MKKHLAIVAAAALTVGSASFVFAEDAANPSNANTDRTQTTGDKVGGALDTAGEKMKDAAGKTKDAVVDQTSKIGIGSTDKDSRNQSPHAAAIHNVLANVAESAFSKNGIKDVADNFAKADRDRLDQGDALKSDDTYDGRIAQLKNDWKAKYNDSFDIKDEDKVLNTSFAMIDEMAASDAARTASGTLSGDATTTPPTASPNTANPNAGDTTTNHNTTDTDKAKADVRVGDASAHVGVGTNDNANATEHTSTSGDANVTANGNRDTATVHIAASHGLPALDVPMVKETMGWRIDVPDSVDSAKLKSNLLTAMTDIGNMKDQWPADQEEAQRHVTHRVLLAIFDKSAADASATPGAAPATDLPAAPSAAPSAPNTSSTPDASR